ncbi:MAG: ribose-phosphate pyrophosphokinase [candidate division KSB1 bacterium]|nr:ribose-phosphate pyrophosphokinase [candidate division KSB1 bacterium]MDZ7302791.1 ribose-phosphate pyrophosphokinase [candidate division KSB1 bacterium]MDZ7310044.1 ribose-phosphate pyrophosphokinase [candidate division KSB1 bacterium]
MQHPRLFSGRAHPELAQRIAAYLNLELGKTEFRDFSDGETWVKYSENIRGQDVFIIQPTNAPARNILELLIMIDAARRASARRITAVIPYFGYARQDRKDQPRVSITAKLVANLLTTAGADRILTMDLHAPQIQGFFDIPLDHLYSATILADYFRQKALANLVVVSPDVGGSHMARAYAKRLHAPIALVDKRRPRPNAVEMMNIIGNVEGMNALLIDDICDTAGTLTSAAVILKERGALKVYAACTHAILSGPAVERLANSPIDELVVTDTLPIDPSKRFDRMKILSVDELFGRAIMRIHNEESISLLFD